MAISREDFLANSVVGITEVECPEWGGSVEIKPISYADRMAIANRAAKRKQGDVDSTARFETWLFVTFVQSPSLDEEDIPALMKKAAKPFCRVVAKICELAGLTGDDEEKN